MEKYAPCLVTGGINTGVQACYEANMRPGGRNNNIPRLVEPAGGLRLTEINDRKIEVVILS